MARDIPRFEGNERVDLVDMEALSNSDFQANIRHHGDQFLSDPLKSGRAFILDGFAVTNPSAELVTVTLGRAILGQLETGQVFQGVLTSEGEATRTVDAATYANGSYGVYIRFEYVEGDSSSRAFWNPQGASGSEFAQTIPTRRLANWSMRMELATPGAEWLLVGTLTVAASVISVGPTDVRDFYFEGTVDGSYASGWSTEGGGVANDRNADRQQYGVKDLHTFTQAMRQCVEDIKGRGLRRWWEPDIGGMNIGFDAAPVEDTLAVYDANFGLAGSLTVAKMFLDSGNDEFAFLRAFNQFQFKVGGVAITELTTAVAEFHQTDGVNISVGGLDVGFVSTPTVDQIRVGDADFGFNGSTIATPILQFASGDYCKYNRTGNYWDWVIGGSLVHMNLSPDGVIVRNGLSVGHTTTPVDDVMSVGAAGFAMNYNSGDPQLQWDTNDYLEYNSGTNNLTGQIGSVAAGQFLNVLADRTLVHKLFVGPQASADLVTGASGKFLANPSIPASVPRQWSGVRIRARGDINAVDTATQVQVTLNLEANDPGPGDVGIATTIEATPTTAKEWELEADLIFETVGATSIIKYAGKGIFTLGSSGVLGALYMKSGRDATNFETDTAIGINVAVAFTGVGAGDIVELRSLTVEWIP